VDSALDFTRWGGTPLSVNYRRWVITSTGLRQLFRMKFFRVLLMIAWTAGLFMAVLGFLFSQTIASGGWAESFAADFGPRTQAIVSAFTAMVLLYPDIVVQGVYTMIFWGHSYVGLLFSLIALTVLVPRLVTRDRAGNALTVYLSRPLTALDYRLGKLGIIAGVLVVLWTGPLMFGWILSVLFAPDRVFVIYSFVPLGHALLFNVVSLVVLAAVAFGVSSLFRATSQTMLLWIGLWIIAGTVAQIPFTPAWLRHASFRYNLEQIQREIFKPGEALAKAAEALPLIDRGANRILAQAGDAAQPRDVTGAWLGLAVLTVAGSAVFLRRLKPE
jgi:ABC-2 type transport system permease protein